jgi:hypothetical protein
VSNSAPIVNEKLAAFLADEPDPTEALAKAQGNALLLTAMVWKAGVHPDLNRGRLVALECGHFTLTKALYRAKCRRCGEMIRSGYDYDAFRNLGVKDGFSWPGDPLRPLHEALE